MTLWPYEDRASSEVKATTERHIEELQLKIEELQSMRRTLEHLIEHRHGDSRPDCPILKDFVEGPAESRAYLRVIT